MFNLFTFLKSDLMKHLKRCNRRNVELIEHQVLLWSIQLLKALEYLHSATDDKPIILHGDIKPE